MKLKDLNGQEFELIVLGYQFPQIVDDEWDSNWLDIQIRVNSKKGNWIARDPSLETIEIKLLAEWFLAISNDKKVEEIWFTEPCLKFDLINKTEDMVTIRIFINYEMKPEKIKVDDEEDFFIDYLLDKKELIQASKELKEYFKEFPVRGKRD